MASTSAASAGSSAANNFNRLLKQSKVLSQYSPSLPVVLTSHGGHFARSEFGLKRPLPKLRSAAVRVAHLDSPVTKLTDFHYSSRELQFVKRFKEAGLAVHGQSQYENSHDTSLEGENETIRNVAERPGACSWDTDSYQSIEDLKEYARTGSKAGSRRQREEVARALATAVEASLKATEGEPGLESVSSDDVQDGGRSFPPDYLHMEPAQFERFVEQLRSLRPKYKAFLQEHLSSSSSSDAAGFATALLHEPDTVAFIDEFLSQGPTKPDGQYDPALETLRSVPHHALGLAYAPPNLYQSDQASRTIPTRILNLAAGGSNSGVDRVALATMGTISRTRPPETQGHASTVYEPDSQGYLDAESGKFRARAQSVRINSHFKRHGGADVDFEGSTIDDELEGVLGAPLPSSATQAAPSGSQANVDPSKTILDKSPITFNMYNAAPQGVSSRPAGGRIGSQGWVAVSPVQKKPLKEMTDRELFYGEMNRNADGSLWIRPPHSERFTGEGRIDRKGDKRREAKAAGSLGTNDQYPMDLDIDSLLDDLSEFAFC